MSGSLLSKQAIDAAVPEEHPRGHAPSALSVSVAARPRSLHISPLRASVLSLGEEDVSDIARCGRKSGTAGLSPSGLVDLVFVANR